MVAKAYKYGEYGVFDYLLFLFWFFVSLKSHLELICILGTDTLGHSYLMPHGTAEQMY